MLRLFVGLPMPSEICAELVRLNGGLPGARWVEPENLHLTLRFLGEIDEAAAADVDIELDRLQMPSLSLTLQGVGCFGQVHQARSLWVGVSPDPELLRMQAGVERAVVRAGLTPEGRRFIPHVTLATLKHCRGDRLADFLSTHALLRLGPFSIDHMVLYESRSGHGGRHYDPLRTYPLQGGLLTDWSVEDPDRP
jgi:RNA 2',3'-cyclic 3'-phosphodiesterase